METIPTCYYSRSLLKLIDSLVDEGYSSYRVLSPADKDQVTAECISVLGDDAYACIIDSVDFYKTLKNFKLFLLSGKKDDAYELASIMKENANDYFDEPMNALFEERKSMLEYQDKIEHNFFPYTDQMDGSTIWRKSA